VWGVRHGGAAWGLVMQHCGVAAGVTRLARPAQFSIEIHLKPPNASVPSFVLTCPWRPSAVPVRPRVTRFTFPAVTSILAPPDCARGSTSCTLDLDLTCRVQRFSCSTNWCSEWPTALPAAFVRTWGRAPSACERGKMDAHNVVSERESAVRGKDGRIAVSERGRAV
jgi:hypothetical protein